MTCQSLILIQSLFTLQLQILKVNSLGHKLNSLKMNILPELLIKQRWPKFNFACYDDGRGEVKILTRAEVK